MRLLLLNPNTSADITALLARRARHVASSGTDIVPVTAMEGAAVIATRADMAVAEGVAIRLLERESHGCDAAIVAASLDSGVQAGKQALTIPVLGLTEAVLHAACLAGGRFGAIVLSARGAAVFREMVAAYGLAERCAGLRAADAGPRDLLDDPDRVAALIAAAATDLVRAAMTDSIVLIGAVMADMAARVQPLIDVPVLEGASCAVALAEAMVRLRLPKPRAGSYALPFS